MSNVVNNLTKKQHYVPQVYLRGFSHEYIRLENKEDSCDKKHTVHCYDIKEDIQRTDIPIKSICYEPYLYELKDGQNELIRANYLEHVLGNLEREFPKYRKRIEQKAFVESNLDICCFLGSEERTFWLTYLTVQIMRSPKTINEAMFVVKEFFGDKLDKTDVNNAAIMHCLPFFKSVDMNDSQVSLFKAILEPMLNMYFSVCVDDKGKFSTSDNPVFIYAPVFPCEEYEKIVFPITSQICLILHGGGEKKKCIRKNYLFCSNERIREMIFNSLLSKSNIVISNHSLDSNERKWIKIFKKTEEDA